MFLIFKTKKEENETLLVAQTPSREERDKLMNQFNDNSKFVRDKFGNIKGDVSIIESYEKEEFRNLNQTIDLENQD